MTHPDMDPLSREARVLAEARLGFSPTPGDLERALAGLGSVFGATELLSPELATPPTAPPPLASGGASLSLKGAASLFTIKALIASSALSLAVGFGAGFGVSRAIEFRASPAAQSTELTNGPETPAQSPPAQEAEIEKPVAPENPERVALTAPLRSPHRQAESSKAPPAELTPYDELNTVRNAQSALKAGDGLRALGLMSELRGRTKGGGLLAERGMIEVLALCQLGRADEARSLAESLLKRSPDFAYARRLRGSCALESTANSSE